MEESPSRGHGPFYWGEALVCRGPEMVQAHERLPGEYSMLVASLVA